MCWCDIPFLAVSGALEMAGDYFREWLGRFMHVGLDVDCRLQTAEATTSLWHFAAALGAYLE